jgi:NAD-dependent deacetylase
VFLVIGTSALVWPAAGLATEARRRGAFLVEINPEATGLTDDVDLALQGAAGEVLHRIVG